MQQIKPGKYVELSYDLYEVTPDGEKLVHQSTAEDPERFIFGMTPGAIIPLEKAIDGLEAGGEFDVTVASKDAFGDYDLEQIVTLPRDVFEIDGKFDAESVKPGVVLPMMTADGYRISGVVKEVTPDDVKMDFNHPLAGKDVRFKGKVTLVRDATPEELQPAGCGCGCSSCGDADCDCDSVHRCGDSSCGCGN